MLSYLALAILVVLIVIALRFRQVIVFEYERGIRYRRGRFAGVLGPGAYWIWPRTTTITKLDVRPAYAAVPGQEVITADGVGIKITVTAKYRVADPERAVNSIVNYQGAVYTQLQLALREIVAASPVDSVLENRADVNRRLLEAAAPKAAEFGVELLEAEVKDVMFPGELKKVFAQVVKARQEGLAALERARGETAALRNLANAAALLEQRPALMQLRLLQTVGQASGNTVVVGLGGQPQTIPLRQALDEARTEELPRAEETED